MREFSLKSISILDLVTVLVFGISGHKLSGGLGGGLRNGSG